MTAANEAVDAYLVDEAAADEAVAAEIEDAGLDAEDPADVRTAINTVEGDAEALVDDLVFAAGAAADGAFEAANAAGQSALITAARALLAAEVTADEAALGAAQADIDAIDGLQEAITAYEAALAAEEAAFEADDIAAANLVGEIADIEARNPTFSVVADETDVADVTIQIGAGAIVPVFEYNAVDEVWELTDAATEETYPGITDLFNAFVAAFDAHAAGVAADTAEDDAFDDMDEADGALDGNTDEYDALVAAQDALDDGNGAGSEVDLADFEEAVAALEAIGAIVDQLDALDDDVSDAENAIGLAGYDLNDGEGQFDGNGDGDFADDVDVDFTATTDANENELLTVDFGTGAFTMSSGDVISVTGFTFNDGASDTDGDNGVLEFFVEEDAGDLVVTFETVAFGSNATNNLVDGEIVEITLTGLSLEDVVIGSNYITLA